MRGSQVVVLATPVLAIVALIERIGPSLPAKALLTDVGSTKTAVVECALKVFGKAAGKRFLAGHPMAGKEMSGVDYADADLFQKAVWFLSPLPGQNLNEGLFAEYAGWIDQIGARIAMLPAEEIHDDAHDRFNELGGYRLEAKAKQILAGLSFREKDFERPARELSGPFSSCTSGSHSPWPSASKRAT